MRCQLMREVELQILPSSLPKIYEIDLGNRKKRERESVIYITL